MSQIKHFYSRFCSRWEENSNTSCFEENSNTSFFTDGVHFSHTYIIKSKTFGLQWHYLEHFFWGNFKISDFFANILWKILEGIFQERYLFGNIFKQFSKLSSPKHNLLHKMLGGEKSWESFQKMDFQKWFYFWNLFILILTKIEKYFSHKKTTTKPLNLEMSSQIVRTTSEYHCETYDNKTIIIQHIHWHFDHLKKFHCFRQKFLRTRYMEYLMKPIDTKGEYITWEFIFLGGGFKKDFQNHQHLDIYVSQSLMSRCNL